MRTYAQPPVMNTQQKRKRQPLLFPLLLGSLLTTIIAIGAGAYLLLTPNTSTHAAAAAANADCTLIVPDQALTAQGLATPYQLVATKRKMGPCHENNPAQSAFVQGAIIDPATGQISLYNPLVIDKGSTPAVAPVVPTLPANAVVAVWFGFNGTNLTLKGANGQVLQNNNCVNGLNASIFGQFAYCNAPTFFQAAQQAITAGTLVPPALGMGMDGKPCPSVRDFSVVDQDQSDNVDTAYLVDNQGRIAQMNAANSANLQVAQTLTNASDNRLVSIALDGALGCKPWTAPDLADPGQNLPSLPLNELQASVQQQPPAALIPAGDPMVLLNNNPDLTKINAYRMGVDQPAVQTLDQASTNQYCTDLFNTAPARIQLDQQFTMNRPSPDAAAANSLFTFLAQRFNTTWGANGLNCQNLLKKASPLQVQTQNGVAVAVTFNATNNNGNGNMNNGNTTMNNGNTTTHNGTHKKKHHHH